MNGRQFGKDMNFVVVSVVRVFVAVIMQEVNSPVTEIFSYRGDLRIWQS